MPKLLITETITRPVGVSGPEVLRAGTTITVSPDEATVLLDLNVARPLEQWTGGPVYTTMLDAAENTKADGDAEEAAGDGTCNQD
jgi:hypothetical protein